MLSQEADHGCIPGASVEYIVEWQPRDDIHPKAAAPAALRRVATLRPGLVIHLLQGTAAGRG